MVWTTKNRCVKRFPVNSSVIFSVSTQLSCLWITERLPIERLKIRQLDITPVASRPGASSFTERFQMISFRQEPSGCGRTIVAHQPPARSVLGSSTYQVIATLPFAVSNLLNLSQPSFSSAKNLQYLVAWAFASLIDSEKNPPSQPIFN